MVNGGLDPHNHPAYVNPNPAFYSNIKTKLLTCVLPTSDDWKHKPTADRGEPDFLYEGDPRWTDQGADERDLDDEGGTGFTSEQIVEDEATEQSRKDEATEQIRKDEVLATVEGMASSSKEPEKTQTELVSLQSKA